MPSRVPHLSGTGSLLFVGFRDLGFRVLILQGFMTLHSGTIGFWACGFVYIPGLPRQLRSYVLEASKRHFRCPDAEKMFGLA